MVQELSVEDLKARLDAGEQPLVIDVREGWELDISKVPFAEHVPMAQVPNRVGEFDADTPIIVMCRSGGRNEGSIRSPQARIPPVKLLTDRIP